MNKELDDKLVQAFPNLYADRNAPMNMTAMCWGFEFGDGWKDIIWGLSEKLEAMILALPEEERKHYKASQCKEKFGSMRVYMTASTDEMEEAIDEAEMKSEKTCEICGKLGKIVGQGWYYAACREHCKEQDLAEFESENDE